MEDDDTSWMEDDSMIESSVWTDPFPDLIVTNEQQDDGHGNGSPSEHPHDDETQVSKKQRVN